MPTVTVIQKRLFEALGHSYTDQELDELCFSFGLELDQIVEESMADLLGGSRSRSGLISHQLPVGTSDCSKTGKDVPITCLKIEVPANRYDLLCFEGIVQAFRVFLALDDPKMYLLRAIHGRERIHVARSVYTVRPYIVGAVLRGLDLRDPFRYQSLLDLQDKLHQNLGRRRSLVAIGTHDLDAVRGPFRYEARAPHTIRFKPLAESHEMDGVALIAHYENDKQLKKCLPLIRDSPAYPVLCDAEDTVLSLPPIINGDRSKVRTETRNMLIECTGTDFTKTQIVLNTIVAMFSRYCAQPFTVEPMAIAYSDEYPRDCSGFSESLDANHVLITPDIRARLVQTRRDDIERILGVPLGHDEIRSCLSRMQLTCEWEKKDPVLGDYVNVSVPVTRSDIIHACDIVEDVGIAYGFNRIPERTNALVPMGSWQFIQKLSDQIRHEFANQGYLEVLTWVTVSHEENFTMLQRESEGCWPNGVPRGAVQLGNPKTLEFQECRTSLLPGLLKTLRESRNEALPLRLFEVGDVVLLDSTHEVGARNERRAAAIYMDRSAGFEIIKHLLDRLMQALEPFHKRFQNGYRLEPYSCHDELFFPGRRADIVLTHKRHSTKEPRDVVLGTMGWIHPRVLKSFNLSSPVSAMEMRLVADGTFS